MAILNRVSIADPAKLNRNVTLRPEFDYAIKKGPLGQEISDQEKSQHFARAKRVTVPITHAVKERIEEDRFYSLRQDRLANVETFEENSKLSNPAAKLFVKTNHYKTPITAANSWRDADTGKVYLFEKQGVPTRLA